MASTVIFQGNRILCSKRFTRSSNGLSGMVPTFIRPRTSATVRDDSFNEALILLINRSPGTETFDESDLSCTSVPSFFFWHSQRFRNINQN
jgi:hypothetical protein